MALRQDRRSANRFREHSKAGCALTVNLDAQTPNYPGHRLYRCACGWFGWLIPTHVA